MGNVTCEVLVDGERIDEVTGKSKNSATSPARMGAFMKGVSKVDWDSDPGDVTFRCDR